jgi:cleavage and polyadenylation specificity factor subunit 3
MNEPEEITTLKGNTIPRNCSVDYISFSAHVDGTQNEEFIDLIKAQHVVGDILGFDTQAPDSPSTQILVHGEQGNMSRLRAKLQHKYKERNEDIKIHTPRNLETLKLSFRGERVAKVRLP